MKRIFAFLVLVAALCVSASAAPTPLIYATISNTTYTVASFSAQGYNPPLQNATITHGALSSTNALAIPIYSNSQGTTTNGRVLIGTWYPSTTNAATETIVGSNLPTPTNYLSIDITTTNAVQLTGSYGN